MIVVDRDALRALRAVRRLSGRTAGKRWRAGSGAIWSLHSNRLRPETWTSADAAGLPILPGLARYEEVARGGIDHALRFTAPRTRKAFIYPARHYASSLTDPDLPPMGLRVRLKASFDVSRLPAPGARRARGAQALRDDPGRQRLVRGTSAGAPTSGWNNDDLHSAPARDTAGDFEVVRRAAC